MINKKYTNVTFRGKNMNMFNKNKKFFSVTLILATSLSILSIGQLNALSMESIFSIFKTATPVKEASCLNKYFSKKNVLLFAGASATVLTIAAATMLIQYRKEKLIYTELCEACQSCDTERLQQVLQNCTAKIINKLDENERTPLFTACENDANIEIIKILIERGANINATSTQFHLLPLHQACLYGCTKVIEFLLPYYTTETANKTLNDGGIALFISLATNNTDVIKLLFPCYTKEEIEAIQEEFKQSQEELKDLNCDDDCDDQSPSQD